MWRPEAACGREATIQRGTRRFDSAGSQEKICEFSWEPSSMFSLRRFFFFFPKKIERPVYSRIRGRPVFTRSRGRAADVFAPEAASNRTFVFNFLKGTRSDLMYFFGKFGRRKERRGEGI